MQQRWCIPPKQNSEYVWHMEDVLDLYEEEYDPKRPAVCFDEMPYQLVSETRVALPMEAGKPKRCDYEYKREGTRNVFMCLEPKAGRRHVEVTERRTKLDFAAEMRQLVDELYPEAERIRVVLDQLNTHTGASLYEAYEPCEARRILSKLEFHYTPKHGSWLNQAEIELSVLMGQCLDRRIGAPETLEKEIAAWERERNASRATVEWRFTSRDARHKLHRLYPHQS